MSRGAGTKPGAAVGDLLPRGIVHSQAPVAAGISMDWHKRYLRQASWTRELRAICCSKRASRAPGAFSRSAAARVPSCRILHPRGARKAVVNRPSMDSISPRRFSLSAELMPWRAANPGRCTVLALSPADLRDHLLSLPALVGKGCPRVLHEMRRVTQRGGHVIAFAEPAYNERTDLPASLARLGGLQQRSLIQQEPIRQSAPGWPGCFRTRVCASSNPDRSHNGSPPL